MAIKYINVVGLVAGCVLAVASMGTLAQDSLQGNAEAGKSKTAACAGCHGADGNSASPNFPKLAGQGEDYLVKQLEDFKYGTRINPIMQGQVAGLKPQDMADIAAYYAEQESTYGKADPELVLLGKQVFLGGNVETGVAACAACHGATGAGAEAAGYPRLAGQQSDYMVGQLKAFRAAGRDDMIPASQKRTNDSEDGVSSGMMQDIAARMSDKEIVAVSSYMSGLY